MSQCPSCRTEGAYVGLVNVECPSPRCCHYATTEQPIVFNGGSHNLKTTTGLLEVVLKTTPLVTTFILAYNHNMGVAVYKGAPPKSLPFNRDCVAVQVEYDPIQTYPWYVKKIAGTAEGLWVDGVCSVSAEVPVMGPDQLHVTPGLYRNNHNSPYLEFSDIDLTTSMVLDSSLPGEILITHADPFTFVERIA